MNQRTIERAVAMEGVGIHTGKKVSLNLRPSPANSGINFIRVDLPNKPLLNIQSLDLKGHDPKSRRTAIGSGNVEINTVEHLMSALNAFGIDNIVIEVDNIEIPAMDGSARDFVIALKKAGIREERAPRKILAPEAPVWVEGKDAFLAIFPSEEFRISYTLSYARPRRLEGFYSILVNERNFEKEIAPARTFCFEEEALLLLKLGFGKGANYGNTLVIGRDGPVKNKFRFADEPVRHKILDLVGDIYLAGRRVRGHVVAIKSGHRMNMELVKKLKELL